MMITVTDKVTLLKKIGSTYLVTIDSATYKKLQSIPFSPIKKKSTSSSAVHKKNIILQSRDEAKKSVGYKDLQDVFSSLSA